MTERPLGMRKPTDNLHVELYPVRRRTLEDLRKPTPVLFGTNWYSAFDRPLEIKNAQGKVTSYWIGKGTSWGRVRGGHCYCIKPPKLVDLIAWWEFYDQGEEGACVGFGSARMMSLLNRHRYAGEAIYNLAQRIDEWDDTPPEEGTSVRAGCDVLRTLGAPTVLRGKVGEMSVEEGIKENRWVQTVEDIAWCLSPEDNGASILNRGYITMLNSWGRSGFPHLTNMPLEAAERLVIAEGGEGAIVTDR
jgi:hypothetical protein